MVLVAGSPGGPAAGREENVRVVFDAYWWVQGPTSLQRVLREIVIAWRAAFPDDELAIVTRARDRIAAESDVPPGVRVVGSRLRPQALLAAYGVEPVRRRLGFDVVLTQNFAARSRGLSAVYLHDVLFLTDPGWFTRTERRYFSLMPRWVRRADVVFSSTVTEGERIAAHTRARAVVPVGLGLSTELVDSPDRDAVPGLEPGHFLLSVGRLNVRKNLERTIHGALDSGVVTPARPLVVVGAGNDDELASHPRIRAAVQDGRVRFTGHVSDAQLRWLYSETCLFLFLSLGEGFGMPPVEAQHFGAPLLVSDIPVLRENLGAGAAYVDPLDEGAIAAAMALEVTRPSGRRLPAPDRHSWRETVTRMRSELAALEVTESSRRRRRRIRRRRSSPRPG
jgi:glycosyltransferase involved in cell wall biosynthesis